MKRARFASLILLVFITLMTRAAHAQPHAFYYNSYFAAGIGPNLYFSHAGQSFGFGADVTVGKWLLTTTGMRAQIDMQMASASSSLHPYFYGHVDIFFDLLTALKGRNPSNIVRSYILLGVGIVHSSEGDNDFCGVAGLGVDFKISDDWRLYCELQSLVHPSDFDDNTRSSNMATFSVGAVRDIAFNPTRSRNSLETNRFSNDWFFNVAFGINHFRYDEGEQAEESGLHSMPVFEFGMGKRLNSLWQIRLAASGLYASSSEERFSYYNLRGDIMFDIAAAVGNRRVSAPFTVRPYASAGLVTRLDSRENFLFSPSAGLQAVYRPMRNHEIFFDARYVVTPPRFAHVESPQGTLSVGLATLILGYSYTFSRNSFR